MPEQHEPYLPTWQQPRKGEDAATSCHLGHTTIPLPWLRKTLPASHLTKQLTRPLCARTAHPFSDHQSSLARSQKSGWHHLRATRPIGWCSPLAVALSHAAYGGNACMCLCSAPQQQRQQAGFMKATCLAWLIHTTSCCCTAELSGCTRQQPSAHLGWWDLHHCRRSRGVVGSSACASHPHCTQQQPLH